MNLIIPKCVQSFKCKGGSCSDNCCIGWEIDIDPVTFAKYSKVSGSLGERLALGAVTEADGSSHFALSGERCPFLNKENLCDIITELGEGYLCDICREHPRFYTTLGDTAFGGVGMCCEEAARLILSEQGEHSYAEIQDYDAEPEECDGELFELVLQYKQIIVCILCDKTLDLSERIALSCEKVGLLQSEIDGLPEQFPPCASASPEEDLISFYASLEYLGGELMERLRATRKNENRKPTLSADTEKYITNTFLYFIDRYFLRAVEDGDALSKMMIASVSTLVIALLLLSEENPNLEKAIYIAKLYSKEIEYNEDNIARIEKMTRRGLWELAGSLWESVK